MRRLSDASAGGTRAIAYRAVPRALSDVFPLVMLCVAFIYSDARFTFMDDEARMLSDAAQPVRAILAAFRSAGGWHAHPPLYDLWLHLWLALTGGAPNWLRVPSIVFFAAGLWLLSRAARLIGGEQSATALLWTAALWPYGFHYGRLAGGYSFTFLLISALTWAYLRYAVSPSRPAWAAVCLLSLALVYTNYFGWVLLALLGVEDWIRTRDKDRPVARRLLVTAALLLAAYLPLWRAFLSELQGGVDLHPSWRTLVCNAAYNIYVLLVSESVAPWYWRFGVPAALAVAACLVLVFLGVRGEARRFLLYGALLFACMAVLGILNARRLFLVAPWFLLPAAVALGTMHAPAWRRLMALSLAVVAGIGWYGVLFRSYYAAPKFIEPWADIAVEAGKAVRDGAAVLGNNPSFFLYLTYALRAPQSPSPWHFAGSLPYVVRYPQIWGPDDWQTAGHPLRPYVLWIFGMPPTNSMEDAGKWLDQHCGERTDRHLVRDSGYVWKQRFFPQLGEPAWRVEIRQYSCGDNSASSSSGAVAPSPPR